MLLPLSNYRKKALFFLKKIFCVLLVYSGICRLFSFMHRNSVKILVYHGIINENLPSTLNSDDLHLQRESFERQIIYLKKHYHILGLNEFIEYLKEARAIPKYSVVLTFDDGYKNNYENLKNIILKYRIPVTIFLVTDYIDTSQLLWMDKLEVTFFKTKIKSIPALPAAGINRIAWRNDEEKMEKYLVLKNYLKKMPHDKFQGVLKNLFSELAAEREYSAYPSEDTAYTRLMNWDEVKELSRLGVCFGSHTCNHEILTVLAHREVEDTLQKSFSMVKEHCLDERIPFSYPNGSFNEEIKQAVAKVGYNCGLTTVHGFNSKDCDLYALKRNEIGNRGDIHIFIATLSGVLDFIKSLLGG